MYIPSAFRNADPDELANFIDRHSFATLITHDATGCVASHLPMLLQRRDRSVGRLVAHMARANPQWKQFATENDVLAIFHGPHCYISPTWYTIQPSVPTWNYAAVHVYGRARLLHDENEIRDTLAQLVAKYEAQQPEPWSGELPDDYRERLIRSIVAFEIEVTRIEGQFKLSQNRSEADTTSIRSALAQHPQENERSIARMMNPS